MTHTINKHRTKPADKRPNEAANRAENPPPSLFPTLIPPYRERGQGRTIDSKAGTGATSTTHRKCYSFDAKHLFPSHHFATTFCTPTSPIYAPSRAVVVGQIRHKINKQPRKSKTVGKGCGQRKHSVRDSTMLEGSVHRTCAHGAIVELIILKASLPARHECATQSPPASGVSPIRDAFFLISPHSVGKFPSGRCTGVVPVCQQHPAGTSRDLFQWP